MCRRTGKPVGRPPGKHHDKTIRVRLPSATVDALKQIARREKVSVSYLVRGGVDRALADTVPILVKIARDTKRGASVRMKAASDLMLFAKAGLFLSPYGLKIARSKAAHKAEEVR